MAIAVDSFKHNNLFIPYLLNSMFRASGSSSCWPVGPKHIAELILNEWMNELLFLTESAVMFVILRHSRDELSSNYKHQSCPHPPAQISVSILNSVVILYFFQPDDGLIRVIYWVNNTAHIGNQYMLCYWLNKLLYYCKTQWDCSCQNDDGLLGQNMFLSWYWISELCLT